MELTRRVYSSFMDYRISLFRMGLGEGQGEGKGEDTTTNVAAGSGVAIALTICFFCVGIPVIFVGVVFIVIFPRYEFLK